jgi:hypothetical protein
MGSCNVGFPWDSGVCPAIVGWSTYAVVQLQRRESDEAKRELEEYKLTVEGKVADAKKEGIEAAGEKAGNALLRAAELEKQAEGLRAANLALEAEIAPRRLTELQIKAIGSALSSFSGKKVSIVSYSLDSEAAILSQQIASSLEVAKIEVRDLSASVMPMGFLAGDPFVWA